MTEKLIEINNLKTCFFSRNGEVPAVDGVSFYINKGETLGLVGESGSGKSITSLSIMRLIPSPPGKIVSGEILFEGIDLLKKTENEMRSIRGNKISMIFQEPMTALNPVLTVGYQICEAICLHQKVSKKEAFEKAVELLKLVGISLPEKRINEYPHQLSGGMRQRVMIAMALSCHPQLLIADEPTTALDVTIQAQILDIMKDLKEKLGMSILMITHDLGVIAEVADRVIVMYAGKIVESAPVNQIFGSPQHPYTQGLLHSIPRVDGNRGRLHVIKGAVPRPSDLPTGCRFHPRCEFAQDICTKFEPKTEKIGEDRYVSCWMHTKSWDKGAIPNGR